MRALILCLTMASILISAHSYAYVSATLFETLLAKNTKYLDSAISKLSLDNHTAKQLKNSVIAATQALKRSDKDLSGFAWDRTLINYMDNTGNKFSTLKRFQSEYVGRMDHNQISKALNEYILLAETKGARRYLLLAGDNCSLNDLGKVGIKRVLSLPKKDTTVGLLSYKLPKSISSIKRHTKRKFKDLKLGNYSRDVALKLKSDIEYRQLAYFTGVLEEGTVLEKKLAKSIIAFNRTGKDTYLLKYDKFWRIFSDISSSDLTPSQKEALMSNLSDALDSASSSSKSAVQKHKSFKEMLEQNAEDNPALKQSYKKYIDSKCY